MNILLPKINLLKDISKEYATSAKSLQTVQKQCEALINRLQFELTLRLQEKGRFITKVGVSLRDLLLQSYRELISKIHNEYCRNEEIMLGMMHQYKHLQETIQSASFSYEQLLKLKRWTVEQSNFMKFRNARIHNQSILLNKENQYYQPIDFDKNTFKPNQWINSEKRENKWLKKFVQNKSRKDGLIEMHRKIQQAQIAELDSTIQQCLLSLADFSFCIDRRKLQRQGGNSQYKSQPSPCQPASHGISLGLQSLSDGVDLLCTEQIDDLSLSRTDQLQKITQREEEYCCSSVKQSPSRSYLLN